jgi:hypothetical protein
MSGLKMRGKILCSIGETVWQVVDCPLLVLLSGLEGIGNK